jgi:hypothetical protein
MVTLPDRRSRPATLPSPAFIRYKKMLADYILGSRPERTANLTRIMEKLKALILQQLSLFANGSAASCALPGGREPGNGVHARKGACALN